MTLPDVDGVLLAQAEAWVSVPTLWPEPAVCTWELHLVLVAVASSVLRKASVFRGPWPGFAAPPRLR